MLDFFWEMTLLGKLVVVIVIILVVVKVYVKWTLGICHSRRRMDGKTVIITGANTGIGKETAKDLARRGARVILACRSIEKGQTACVEIQKATGNKEVIFKQLDLSSLKSVREFAADILKTEPRLDVLINNAGIAGLPEKVLTEDGLELTMATNHFGPFLVTNLLIDLLKQTAPSRIVNVSSLAHWFGKIQFDNLNSEKHYNRVTLYPHTKLANVLFTRELATRLEGTEVTANSLHPGTINTELLRNLSHIMYTISWFCGRLLFQTPEEGAQTSILLAVSEELEGISGKYFAGCKIARMSTSAQDDAVAQKLWEISEVLVKLKPDEMHL